LREKRGLFDGRFERRLALGLQTLELFQIALPAAMDAMFVEGEQVQVFGRREQHLAVGDGGIDGGISGRVGGIGREAVGAIGEDRAFE
jgi:hypothetical protein